VCFFCPGCERGCSGVLNHLTDAIDNYDSLGWAYDSVSNRLSQTQGYDGFGQRAVKAIHAGARFVCSQNGMLLEETNASGVAQADYIYLNGRPVAVLNGSTLYYLHDDRLGTPQVASDSSQNIQWQASYEPFGTTTSVSGTITQNLRFPGQYFDVESGWNHNGFRDYLPALGRYAEPDPLGRLGSGNNPYIYVSNNPVGLSDPFGLCPSCKIDPGLAPFINVFGTTVDTIMGEEAPPSVVGRGQYQYGDTLGNPTGPTITDANS
jgi:RHS repeat-associated protein